MLYCILLYWLYSLMYTVVMCIWVFGVFFPSFIFIAPYSVVLEAWCLLWGFLFVVSYSFCLFGWVNENELLTRPSWCFLMLWSLCFSCLISTAPSWQPASPARVLVTQARGNPAEIQFCSAPGQVLLFPILKCGLLWSFHRMWARQTGFKNGQIPM